MRPPPQRLALGTLFVLLAGGFGVVAVAAARADRWVIAAAAVAIGAWIASLGWRGLRGR